MRQKYEEFYFTTVMENIAGVITKMAPLCKPRNLDEIISEFAYEFKSNENCVNNNEMYSIKFESNDSFNNWLEDTLKSIQAFRNLNLSQEEVDHNISVDDENRNKYNFTSAYDKYDSESWKTDFIDLDACIGNILNAIYFDIDHDDDCFLCMNEGTDACRECYLNPNFTNNIKYCLRPYGREYTRGCLYTCKKSKIICCYDCDKRDTCSDVCNENESTCSLMQSYKCEKGDDDNGCSID